MARPRVQMKSGSYIEQAIVQLLSLKIRAGSSLADVRQLVQDCLSEASDSVRAGRKSKGLDIHKLGSILRTWHTESRYLTFDGLPRPLAIEGRLSLRTLVKRYYAAHRFEAVFERLLDAKLIRRLGSNEWVPSGRTARIPQVSIETLEHVSEGIVRYVETATRNVTAKSEQDLLFERSCKVTKLPLSEINPFREYVGQQALAFLTSVDDWLESRSSKARSSGRCCTAGVHTFAFMIGNKSQKLSRTKQSASR